MLVIRRLTAASDFNRRKQNTMEVNGAEERNSTRVWKTMRPKVIPNAICGICQKGKEANKKGKPEALIHCSQCQNSGHPSCLDMSVELVSQIKMYPWQCMECKTCTVCEQPHHEEEMMFCDKCDRGYHTFCVGMHAIPLGCWVCDLCNKELPTPQKKGTIKTPKKAK